MVSTGLGLVALGVLENLELLSIELNTVECLEGSLSVFLGLELDKGLAAGLTVDGVSVELERSDISMDLEELEEILLGDVLLDVSHE